MAPSAENQSADAGEGKHYSGYEREDPAISCLGQLLAYPLR
jgi:hypothetical protein